MGCGKGHNEWRGPIVVALATDAARSQSDRKELMVVILALLRHDQHFLGARGVRVRARVRTRARVCVRACARVGGGSSTW